MSAPIVLAVAGGLAYLRSEWSPANGTFLVIVAAAAAAAGASVVRLWMGETAFSALPTIAAHAPSLARDQEAMGLVGGRFILVLFRPSGDGFLVSYGDDDTPRTLEFQAGRPAAALAAARRAVTAARARGDRGLTRTTG